MPAPTTAPPFDRILDGARACFAAKGFSGTTIADIEAAAGYTPRSGGLYRHVRSKVELLEAVIDRELATNRADVDEQPVPTPGDDPIALLEVVVRRALARLDQQTDLMRIVFRDLDRFPQLVDRVREGLTDRTYRAFADRLAEAHAAGFLPPLDFEAVAVLAIGPLVNYKVKQHLLGYVPLGLDEDRLVRAWVDQFATLFGYGR